MKQAIWKYELDLAALDANSETTVSMPLGAQILTVREQADKVCVWALVDTKEQRIAKKKFAVIGTGHDAGLRSPQDFLASAMLFSGRLVLHVFKASR